MRGQVQDARRANGLQRLIQDAIEQRHDAEQRGDALAFDPRPRQAPGRSGAVDVAGSPDSGVRRGRRSGGRAPLSSRRNDMRGTTRPESIAS